MAGNYRFTADLAIALSVFVLVEVNYPMLAPQAQLSVFALLGLLLVVQLFPASSHNPALSTTADLALSLVILAAFGYVFLQSEPLFEAVWVAGQSLGNRAGLESGLDLAIAALGLIAVFETTRRTVGWTLTLLALAFCLYAAFGPYMPGWLFPHRGYGWSRIASQTFLHSQGVFGIALKVMFTYVFLFVLFGAVLEATGATGFIMRWVTRIFSGHVGGPAKIAVVSSGMMGSLSGSAVANTATTGTFTIPMMRKGGFSREVAGGVEAAASSGGALVPPIMGAGAYMMLEIVSPPVTYLEIIQAAILPAILYYLALLLMVHFVAARGQSTDPVVQESETEDSRFPGIVFLAGFAVLLGLLLAGFTPFRAVSVSLVAIIAVAALKPETRLSLNDLKEACVRAAKGGVALIAAASCVGIIIGVVTLTGIGSRLPSAILPLAQNNLLLALLLLMVSTIILGMGLPSAVCYLLMATLVGPVLGDLGLVPLAAHLFIFYFGMMSMVTPPVALAAYTASAISGGEVMKTAWQGFRFALVGFALPFAFVQRPELLLLASDGSTAASGDIALALGVAVLGIIALAAGLAGFIGRSLNQIWRGALIISGLLLLLAPASIAGLWVQAVAALIALSGLIMHRRQSA